MGAIDAIDDALDIMVRIVGVAELHHVIATAMHFALALARHTRSGHSPLSIILSSPQHQGRWFTDEAMLTQNVEHPLPSLPVRSLPSRNCFKAASISKFGLVICHLFFA